MHRIVLVVAALLFVDAATVAQTPVAPALFVPATDIGSALLQLVDKLVDAQGAFPRRSTFSVIW